MARSTTPRQRTASSARPTRPKQALEIVKTNAFAKFDETVEAVVRLGVDPRHADQVVRGTVVLPEGTGSTVRVLVIAVGDKAREARSGRRGLRRRRVSAEDQGRLAGIRRPHRNAGPDGPARTAWPRPRSSRPHAEPEGGNGDVQRRAARLRRRRPARSSSASTRAATSTSRWARSRSPLKRWKATSPRSWIRSFARSRVRPRASTYATCRSRAPWDRALPSTPLPTGNAR